MDVRIIATLNLAVQAVLLATTIVAAFLARRRQLNAHCLLMRISVIVLIVATLFVMLPSLLGYLKLPQGTVFIEMITHHSLGLLVMVLWVYINLLWMGWIRLGMSRLVWLMRAALTVWIITFLLGTHMYLLIY